MLTTSPHRAFVTPSLRSSRGWRAVWPVLFLILLETSLALSQGGPPPPAPDGLAAEKITKTSATLKWDAVDVAAFYRVEVSASSRFETLVFKDLVTTTSVELKDLLSGTKYYVNVYSVTSGSKESNKPAEIEFTTESDSPPKEKPPVPTGLKSTTTDTTAELSWNPITGAKYDVEVTGPKGFKFDASDISAASLSLTGLQGETKYDWQVRAKNAAGSSDWAKAEFTTDKPTPPPGKPSKLEADPGTTSVTLKWEGVKEATSYHIEVADNKKFDGPITGSATTPGTVVSPLLADKEYFWRVRSVGPGGVSDWEEGNFRTLSTRPSAPKLVAPASGSSDVSTSPSLDWSPVALATSYELQVDTDDKFNRPVFSTSPDRATSKVEPPLDNNKEYFWRVRVTTPGGTSDWSEVWSFKTVSILLDAPKLISPSDNMKDAPNDPTLAWEAVKGAATYTVEVASDSKFNDPVENQSGLTKTSHTLAKLSYDKTYYWRVKAVSSLSESGWSEERSFKTMNLVLPAPGLESPPNNADNVPSNTTLAWTIVPGAVYDVEVAADNKFNVIVRGATGISSNSLELSGLKPGEKHFWHVRATTLLGTGPWSGDRTFTTAAPTLPTPAPVYPGMGEKQVPMNIRFEWKPVPGADEYEIQVALEKQFRVILSEKNGLKETSFEMGKLLPGTTYYWRVRATGKEGASDWPRDDWDFTTASAELTAPSLIRPSDGTKNVDTDPTMDWTPSPRATSYAIQYSPDKNFKKNPVEVTGIRTTQYQVRGLTPQETYYWRVRGEDSKGVSEWSDSWGFTTGSGRLAAPALINPADQSKGVSTSPQFEWKAVGEKVMYAFQYTRDRQFRKDTISVSGIERPSLALTGFLPNEIYYWRVKVQDASGSSEWSGAWNFMTGSGRLARPLLISPSNETKGVSTNPTLEWGQTKGALSYTVQYGLDKNFKKDAILIEGIEKTSLSLKGLLKNETYYWRVSAADSNGSGDWSEESSFTTGSSRLTAPVPIAPSNEAKGVSINPVFEWAAAPSALFYSLQYSTDQNFKRDPITITRVEKTSLRVEGLSKNETYYWRISASDLTASSDWSKELSFKTGSGRLSAPAMISPSDGALGVSITPMVAWSPSPGAESYSLQYATDKNFKKDVVEINNIEKTSYGISELAKRETYYWRLIARDSTGLSDWSGERTFTTGSGRLGAPMLLSPTTGVETPTSPTLQWQGSPDAATYDVQIAADKEFRKALIEHTDLPTTSLTVAGLSSKEEYFWRVRSRNTRETSDWSAEWSFIASSTATSVEPVEIGQPGEFVLHQNYPNPFNPATTIRFSVPNESPVRIVIYTILGSAVETLVDQRLHAGTYEAKWTASSMASGVYFYRIEAGGFVATKRLVLLK